MAQAGQACCGDDGRGPCSAAAAPGIREHRGFVLDKELAARASRSASTIRNRSPRRSAARPSPASSTPTTGIMCRATPRTVAFRSPKVTDQTVLHVRFDQAGNVAVGQQDRQGTDRVSRPVGRQDPDARPQAQLLRRSCSAISAPSRSRACPAQPATAPGAVSLSLAVAFRLSGRA